MTPKQFETEVATGLEKLFVYFKYETPKFSAALKRFLSESRLCVQRKFAICVAILFNLLASVHRASSVNLFVLI